MDAITSISKWELLADNALLRFRKYHLVLAALKGLRNGIVYGTRIRAPHAFVMIFLFGNGTLVEKAKVILRLTRMHATNLGRFVFSYKLITGLMQRIQGSQSEWHSFLAAFIVGYFVFGANNGVNMQINLYLLSRILVGLVKLGVEKQIIQEPACPIFPWFAATVWGVVLWLFEHHQHVLQGSLRSSMTYLYHDSNKWTNFRNFFISNK